MIYAIIQLRSHQRELGSSLPSKGGGGVYEIFEKVTCINKIFKINYRFVSFLWLEMIKPNVKDKCS